MHRRIIQFITAFFCCCTVSVTAQHTDYSFYHLDETNGLLSPIASSVCQDSAGLIWIGTTNGLQRYDGYHFLNYRHDAADPYSLPSNVVEQVVADKQNTLWLLTSDGSICRFNRYQNKFIICLTANRHSTNNVLSLSPTKEIWATVSNAILKYNYATQKFDTVALLKDSNTRFSTAILINHQQTAGWIGSSTGFYYYDFTTKKLLPANGTNASFNIGVKDFIKASFLDAKNEIWFSTYSSNLYHYKIAAKELETWNLQQLNNRFNKDSLTDILITGFQEDSHNNIWIISGFGLLQYHRDINDFQLFTYSQWNRLSVRFTTDMSSIFKDKDENLWISTDRGINCFNPSKKIFNNYFYQPATQVLSFPAAEATSFLQSTNSDIWITTYNKGVVLCDSQLNIKKVFSRNIADGANPKATNNSFWSAAEDKHGNIWIGGMYGSLSIYNPITKKFTYKEPEQFRLKTIRVMKPDKQYNIWFGLQDGTVLQWNEAQQNFITYDSLFRKSGFINAACNDFSFDDQGNIWIANDYYGLLKFDTAAKKIQQFIPFDAGTDKLRDNTVNCIRFYNSTELLIGTMNNGIYYFNTTSNSFKHLKPVNGSFNSIITGISEPVNNIVWIASNNGLNTLDLKSMKLVNYSSEDGLLNTSFDSRLYTINKKFFAGNTNGFITIDPYNNISHPNSKPVVITGVSVFNNPLGIDSLLDHHLPLKLTYKQNFVNISFVLPDYFQNHSLFYTYMLQGVDPGWRIATTNPEAIYTDLKGGKYIFQVRCDIGDEPGPITELELIIEPPFWQTTWFYVLITLICTALIFLLYYTRVKIIRKQERQKAKAERQIQEMKLTVLRTQLNPHFMFNSLNAIQNFILNHDDEKATIYLSRFARLMRMVLDSSQQNLIPLQQEIDTLTLYLDLENIRFNNSLEYSINTDNTVQVMETMVPPLLIQPCIENAIWHGLMYKEGQRKLSLHIISRNDMLCFILQDNGIGRKAAAAIQSNRKKEHISKGISLVEDRLALLGAQSHKKATLLIDDLYNADTSAAGTRITICIPNFKKAAQHEN